MIVTDDRRFTPSDTLSWNDAGNELTLFDEASQGYFALNGPAVTIWRELAGGSSVAETIDALAARFDAPPAAIADDVLAFVGDALDRNLLALRG